MWNFVIGCFILGAATVGLFHGQAESLLGVFVVVLWFSGIFRPACTIWLSFLHVGALAGSAVYAYDAFVTQLSPAALLVGGIVVALLTVAAAFAWIRSMIDARREGVRAPRPRPPVRRRPTHIGTEIVAWIVLVGAPFGAGAWAAEAAFDDQELSRRP